MDQTLLIVYHSRTGGAQQMAQAVQAGAVSAGAPVAVRLLQAQAAQPQDLLQAQAFVWACPENLAAISGEMKEFFDRCYYPVGQQLAGRVYALLVCAGSDGHNAVRQMQRIATGWRLRAVAEPYIVCTHAQTPEAILAPKQLCAEALQPCHALGQALAEGLALGVF